MPEAEDVLLDAAERVSGALRALWAGSPPEPSHDRLRTVPIFLAACLGGDWEVEPSDPPPPVGWLARVLGRAPVWQTSPTDEAFTDGERLYLPRRWAIEAAEPTRAALLRVTALSLAARIRSGAVAASPADPFERDLHWVTEAARTDQLLAREFPGLRATIVRARETALRERPRSSGLTPAERVVERHVIRLLGSSLGSTIGPLPVIARPAGPYRGMATVVHWARPRPDLVHENEPGAGGDASGEGASGSSRHRRLARRVEAVPSPEELGSKSGPFVVPFGDPKHAIQDPAGLRRPVDRDDEIDLEALGDEMERLGKLPTIRSTQPAREVLETSGRPRRRSPIGEEGGVAIGLRYPEWDYRVERYRPRYCTVSESAAPSGDLAWSLRVLERNRRLRDELARRFDRLRPRRLRLVRQLDGDEIDLAAYVEDFADRRSGRSPSERLYVADPARRRDVSVALLIDASASTDAWVDGTRTVVDVEKEAALVFDSMLERLGDRRAIFAFTGRGPRDVRVARLKDFAEASGERLKRAIAGIAAGSYTRLGAALRHVAWRLSRERSRVRLLLLLSDGKPNDEDEYEGRYGIEDTRRAVAEARLERLSVFCLTIDREGPSYLPRLFGARGYAVAAKVAELPERLSDLYRSIT